MIISPVNAHLIYVIYSKTFVEVHVLRGTTSDGFSGQFFVFLKKINFCFDVAICDLVSK